jgi:energy-coupling factor transporter transmembrane protein EcfT
MNPAIKLIGFALLLVVVMLLGLLVGGAVGPL